MSESRMVLEQGEERKSYVREMFNAIAHRYDFLNHFLSGGIDIYWRRKAIAKLDVDENALVLDLASGTADLAIETVRQKRCKVMATDIALRMLVFAKEKLRRKNLESRMALVNGDGESLPFRENDFDAVTIAFGIRNMGTISQALAEMLRILNEGGQAVILEFSLPVNRVFRTAYLFYFKNILPLIGKLVSKDEQAYSYLPASVEKFPEIAEFTSWMKQAGFRDVEYWKLLNGVAVIYKGVKISNQGG